MKKLFRFISVSAILCSLLLGSSDFASAKRSSSKKSAKGKVAQGKKSRHERTSKAGARKGRQEVSRRGGKKLSRRERAQLAKAERRGRGRHSRRGRYLAARNNDSTRNDEALKINEEAPLHVGDEDPQPTNTHFVTAMPPTPAPAPVPRVSGIPSERVSEIQSALQKAGYYQGEISGVYDDTTRQAMKQYQQANNIQATGMPSAHALKKLGVAKRKNDDYAVPVKSATNKEKDNNPRPEEKTSPERQ
jgi:hypothetical protein